ncbi:MAG: hypothetical protein U0401_32640 [Anaerolineae bacterium]
MSEQVNHEAILSKTLQVLVQQHQLTAAELAQIRLSDLHLAGKSPTINFTPMSGQEAKVVQLDLDTHRALVNWLVNRPDAVSDFLFPGSGAEAMSETDLQRLLEQAGGVPVAADAATLPFPPAPPEADEGLPPMPPSASRPLRPVSRPEMGASASAPFQPPSAPPEAEAETATFTPPPGVRPVNPSRPVPKPPAPPETTPAPQPVTASETPKESSAPEPAADATMISAKKPEPPEAKKEPAKAGPPTASTATPPVAASRPVAKTATSPLKQPSRPVQPAMAAKKPAKQLPLNQRPIWARYAFPGLVVVALLLCGICLVGGWFAGQGGPAGQLLASLGLSSAPSKEPTGTTEPTSESAVGESPLPTPTLPSTSTPTSLPPTNTPSPTNTSTPTLMPTDTPTALPTDTPAPTETPVPTDTPKPEPTEAETAAAPTEEPAAPSTKHPAPELLEPAKDFAFIQGNTIVLKWKPVDLAPNEHYAVRLVYQFQGQPTYQGSNIKESEWTIPLALFGQIDPPENRYEWFVQIERENEDGTGTAVSPESEHRFFTWK